MAGWHLWFLLGMALTLGGCATRPINLPISNVDPGAGYRLEHRQAQSTGAGKDTMVILAFSGGGTRAAAFSYGVLEFLRQTRIADTKGRSVRLLDEVDLITGISGGSFTALAYGLYGEKLFDDYEARFLKRNVQGDIIARTLNPVNWGRLASPTWGRSARGTATTRSSSTARPSPISIAAAARSSWRPPPICRPDPASSWFRACSTSYARTSARCRCARAASASSAVPVVLSAVTLSNYGGACNMSMPSWTKPFIESSDPPRPAARAIRTLEATKAFGDSVNRPFLHLVDGGVSDNIGMRGVLDAMEVFEALHATGARTPFDRVKRIVVFVVNSLSVPPTNWDRSEVSPGTVETLLKASGTPIDRYSFESVEQLKDTAAKWRTLRLMRDSAAIKSSTDPAVARGAARSGRRDLRDRRFVRRAEGPRRVRVPEPAAHVVRASTRSSDRLRVTAATIIRHRLSSISS